MAGRASSRVDVPIEPVLALGSWGAFHRMGTGAEVMGDLVLLGPEVSRVVRALEAGGFEILAIHNHLIDETPRVMYVHYHGKGEPAALARTLNGALGRSQTPLAVGPTPAKPTPEQEKTFEAVQDLVGRKGNMAGRVLQLSIPRAEPIIDDGMDVVEPDPGFLLRRGGTHLPAMRAPAPAIGDPPDLLDVHVDQLTGTVAFVTHRGGLRRADHLAGQRVAVGQARDVVATQEGVSYTVVVKASDKVKKGAVDGKVTLYTSDKDKGVIEIPLKGEAL